MNKLFEDYRFPVSENSCIIPGKALSSRPIGNKRSFYRIGEGKGSSAMNEAMFILSHST